MPIYHLLNKNKFLSYELRTQRTAICNTCEFAGKYKKTCKACGCVIWLKARLSTEDCPKGKWPEIDV